MNVAFSMTPAQREIIHHPARIKVAVCGRRWGKTVLMAMALGIVAAQYPGCRCWYVANDYSLVLEQMRMMMKSQSFMAMVAKPHMQFPPRFEMKNGSQIAFRSADRPHLLRGAGLRLICHDEAANSSKELFWEVLAPMTLDTGGTIICGSTYKGRNWFYDLAEKGKRWNADPLSADHLIKTWIYPTSTGMRFQDAAGKKRLEQLKAETDPMTWQQECECEPLAVTGAVFRHVDQCIGGEPEVWNERQPQRGLYVVAQDLGRVEDHSAIIVLNLETGNVAHACEYPLGMLHEDQAKRTRDIAAQYRALVVLDSTGGAAGGRHESYVREYLKIMPDAREINFTAETKRNMVNRLNLDFEQRRVTIPPEYKEVISQCKLYQYKQTDTAIIPQFFGRPDDYVASLMMATWARERGWGPPPANLYKGMI